MSEIGVKLGYTGVILAFFRNDTAVLCSIPIMILLVLIPVIVYMENVNLDVSIIIIPKYFYNFSTVFAVNLRIIVGYYSNVSILIDFTRLFSIFFSTKSDYIEYDITKEHVQF